MEIALNAMAGDLKKAAKFKRVIDSAKTLNQIKRVEKLIQVWQTRLQLEVDWLKFHSDN